mmetsp:Transcript_45545/g.90252  ORF Transcript_45545/g.90252 Transcript_45545/m.90252 type:complete len:170 (-) Transcript_45545:92-601(-)|eukprot:CAMPEP_0172719136 /NCGR_PEP_ID=MMETSP1074-20121228/75334_1 /TAXON_ID=2916 /ORGANISM="Ceratium fusus, Strain PA161109" /LENGTH=169 /DNA_ID=CAMNT_0013544461 /DNA_START=51 /DNA_END=560 /DNA_ORIENTATION=+
MLICPKTSIGVMTLLSIAVAAPRETWNQKQMPLSAFAQDMEVVSAAHMAKGLLTKLATDDLGPENEADLYTSIQNNELSDKMMELVKLTSDLESSNEELKGNIEEGQAQRDTLQTKLNSLAQNLTFKGDESFVLNVRIKKFCKEVEKIADNYHSLLKQTEELQQEDLTD